MGDKTSIEWTDATWNPIRGCSRVSEGCRHCYAEGIAARFGGPGLAYEGLAVMRNGMPHWTGKVEFVERHLLDPLKWGRVKEPCLACQAAEVAGVIDSAANCTEPFLRPRRIFVNSMSDLFHENVTDEMRDKIFAVMAMCPQHTFQVLSKRPARMREYLNSHGRNAEIYNAATPYSDNFARMPKAMSHHRSSGDGWWPLKNVWLGVSVEDQKAADERIPLLLQTPAWHHFISAEPLLEAITLKPEWLNVGIIEVKIDQDLYDSLGEDGRERYMRKLQVEATHAGFNQLDWAIVGGESGPGARPMHPGWARGLRDQCVAAGVSYFFKQWGEYLPAMTDGGFDRSGDQVLNCSDDPVRVGKHAAGALLDGKEWKQFPEAVHG